MKVRAALIILLAGALVLMAGVVAADDPESGSTPDTLRSAQHAAAYSIPWQSVNAGGAPAASTNYQLNGSAGQSAIGFVTSTNYQHGIGYWYGVGTAACNCGKWGDVSADGQVNPIDVVRMVNYVYKGQLDALVLPSGFNCPRKLGDVSCDGNVNPIDVVRYVNYVYKGQLDAFCADPCGP